MIGTIRPWLGLRVPSRNHYHIRFRRRPCVEPLEDRLAPATITVTDTADTIALDGNVTLREAITSINAGANANLDVAAVGLYGLNDTIKFNIPGAGPHTITLDGTLPDISKPMTIDGYTQGAGTASPATANTDADRSNAVLKIVLAGNRSPFNPFGLTIATSNTTIKGLVINDFSDSGIRVKAHFLWINNKIQGNFIGTNAAGTAAALNSRDGVYLDAGATGTTIGGTNPADRNVIAGNGHNGVNMDGVGTLQLSSSAT